MTKYGILTRHLANENPFGSAQFSVDEGKSIQAKKMDAIIDKFSKSK